MELWSPHPERDQKIVLGRTDILTGKAVTHPFTKSGNIYSLFHSHADRPEVTKANRLCDATQANGALGLVTLRDGFSTLSVFGVLKFFWGLWWG